MPLITPENLPEVLTAAGALIAAIGGLTWWRARGEPPKPGTPDAAAVALAENTKATVSLGANMGTMTGQFGENLTLFRGLDKKVDAMADDMADARRAAEASRDHLGAIRDALNRRAP